MGGRSRRYASCSLGAPIKATRRCEIRVVISERWQMERKASDTRAVGRAFHSPSLPLRATDWPRCRRLFRLFLLLVVLLLSDADRLDRSAHGSRQRPTADVRAQRTQYGCDDFCRAL